MRAKELWALDSIGSKRTKWAVEEKCTRVIKRYNRGVYVSQHLSFMLYGKATDGSQDQNRIREIRPSRDRKGPTET